MSFIRINHGEEKETKPIGIHLCVVQQIHTNKEKIVHGQKDKKKNNK